MARVCFLEDDPAALWEAGDEAEILYWEPGDDHLLLTMRLDRDNQIITITDPFDRGLIAEVES